MCITCGCGSDTEPKHAHHAAPTNHHHHHHDDDDAGGTLIQLEQDILSKNQQYASQNRALFQRKGILALNFVSSPGSGKTTLLVKTINNLKKDFIIEVIEGDQQTSNDAERIKSAGAASHQINTGKGCHLDAHMVQHGLEHLPTKNNSLLFIENIGNLVCPSAFDLGEHEKVVIISTTEGDDKPIKYPDMFYVSKLMIINKIDLLPYVDFDVDKCIELARRVNPKIQILSLSAKTEQGMDKWQKWLELQHQMSATVL